MESVEKGPSVKESSESPRRGRPSRRILPDTNGQRACMGEACTLGGGGKSNKRRNFVTHHDSKQGPKKEHCFWGNFTGVFATFPIAGGGEKHRGFVIRNKRGDLPWRTIFPEQQGRVKESCSDSAGQRTARSYSFLRGEEKTRRRNNPFARTFLGRKPGVALLFHQ